jgi:hypothetical protein
LIAAVLIVAAVIGSWLLVIEPKRDRAAKLGDEVTAAQSQVDAANSKLSQARLAQQSFEAESAQLARLGEAVPATGDVASLIYQLQSAANGARVDFRGLQTSPTSASSTASTTTSSAASQSGNLSMSATGGFPTQQFTFTFQGTYSQLARFIDHVQNFVAVKGDRVVVSGRLIALNSINLAAATSGFPKITATIAASTYLMPTAPQATTGSSQPPSAGPSPSRTASVPGSTASPAAPAVATPIR